MITPIPARTTAFANVDEGREAQHINRSEVGPDAFG